MPVLAQRQLAQPSPDLGFHLELESGCHSVDAIFIRCYQVAGSAKQRYGRVTLVDLGRRVALSAPPVAERVQRLEETGVITGYHATRRPGGARLPDQRARARGS
ncbi:Lrp/AsnC family transcriptional regulator [Actinomadura spongiicola]|uniref:Lrp/AsnC family transcriptional regulator n=1 Tax=Actinomadura spongiicola TaxID=2303421 RepID=UPI00389903FA